MRSLMRSPMRSMRLVSAFGLSVLTGCAAGPFLEVPIEIPIEAKLDLSDYGRVLVGAFVTQTTRTSTSTPRPPDCCATSFGSTRACR